MWAWHLPSHHINQTCAAAAIAATAAAAAIGIHCEQEILIKNFFKRIMNKLLNIAHIFELYIHICADWYFNMQIKKFKKMFILIKL